MCFWLIHLVHKVLIIDTLLYPLLNKVEGGYTGSPSLLLLCLATTDQLQDRAFVPRVISTQLLLI